MMFQSTGKFIRAVNIDEYLKMHEQTGWFSRGFIHMFFTYKCAYLKGRF